MSKNPAPKPRNQQRELDARIKRTRQRLGNALLELILEGPMDQVTVQDVLDRASVGRSTFYLHFRDKEDLLLTQLEGFCEMMSNALSDSNEKSDRLMPVSEMFAHIGSGRKLYRAVADSGHLNDFFDLAQGHFARGIAKRLSESNRLPGVPQRELEALACALAGSLVSLLRWWMDRGAKEPPSAMDELFHRIAWGGVR